MTVEQLIDESIKSKREPHIQRHWYISELGSCITGQYLRRLWNDTKEHDVPEFDERTLRVFDVGNLFEEWVSKHIPGEKQVPVEDNDLDISGYVDNVSEDEVYEYKSKHSRAFWYMVDGYRMVLGEDGKKHRTWVEGEGPNRQHQIQLWCYLYLLNRPHGNLIYISKDDLAIQEYPVLLEDAHLRFETLRIIGQLNEAWKNKVVPKLDPEAPDWQSKYCRVHDFCRELGV